MENARVMKEVLDQFYVFSGHKVNASKSMIHFSMNTAVAIRTAITVVFKFQNTKDLGRYLGVPVFHSRVEKNTFQFVVDKVQAKLNGFDAKMLFMVGRIVLSNSVLLAIPRYFMQVAMIPVGICEKIESIVCQFV